MARPKSPVTEYRSYYLPMQFPVKLLSGDHWKISDIPSKRLHFHNCLEIGICHSGSGYMEVLGETLAFHAEYNLQQPWNRKSLVLSVSGSQRPFSQFFACHMGRL